MHIFGLVIHGTIRIKRGKGRADGVTAFCYLVDARYGVGQDCFLGRCRAFNGFGDARYPAWIDFPGCCA